MVNIKTKLYLGRKIFGNDLVAIGKVKVTIMFNKPRECIFRFE